MRGPDENGQLLDLRRQGRDHLLAGGTGADDADAATREVLALGPGSGVDRLALERVQTGQVREVDGGEQSDRVDDIGGVIHGAVVGGDLPLTLVVGVDGGRDRGAEAEVAAQVETVDDAFQVFENLGLGDVRVLPGAVVQQVAVEGVAVEVALGVRQCARVAVPVPGAAGAVCLVETDRGEAEFVVQLVDGVDAAESGADDDGVDGRGEWCVQSWRFLCRSEREGGESCCGHLRYQAASLSNSSATSAERPARNG